MRILIPQSSKTGKWLDPLVTETTATVIFEATSRCNLRCTYCSVSQPQYAGRDMSDEQIELFVRGLLERPPRMLNLSGHGETTILPGWQEKFRRLIDSFDVGLTSNFARTFSEEELERLCRFRSLNISLDTHIPELLAAVRRKVKLETILKNLAGVRRKAAELKLSPPEIYIFCTVYDKNVLHLEEFARFLLPLGIRGVFWANLMKHEDISDGLNVNILPAMTAAEQRQAYHAVKAATKLLEGHGIEVRCWGGYDYFDAMQSSLDGNDRHADVKKFRSECGGDSVEKGPMWQDSFVELCKAGETRDCMHPWDYAHLQADGTVLACCMSSVAVGRVDRTNSLGQVLNNEAARTLRQNLLNGTLDAQCRICPVRKPIEIHRFRRKCLAANYPGDYADRRPRGTVKRWAARLLSATPAKSARADRILQLARSAVPGSILGALAAGTHSELPLGLEELIEFENVRCGSVSLRERIGFAVDDKQVDPASIAFKKIDLPPGALIDLTLEVHEGADRSILWTADVLDENNRIVFSDSTTASAGAVRHWQLSPEKGCRLKLIFSKLTGSSAVPIRLSLDYPIVHEISDVPQ